MGLKDGIKKSMRRIFSSFRYARTFSSVPTTSSWNFTRAVKISGGVFALLVLAEYLDDTRAGIFKLMPWIASWIDPETSHKFMILAGKYNLLPKEKLKNIPMSTLKTTVCGMDFDSPVGLAAGLDRNGEAIESLGRLGFSFVEIGSVTPLPQEGNPRPRVFRLPEDRAIINRHGFSSLGLDYMHSCLSRLFSSPSSIFVAKDKRLGISLGKNKETQGDENILADYALSMEKLFDFADYFCVNVSSPNTPGLRDILSNYDQLNFLLDNLIRKRDDLFVARGDARAHRPPIFIKISPDMDHSQAEALLDNFIKKSNVEGLVICNTTVERSDSLLSRHKDQVGGLSGAPLAQRSLQLTKLFYEGLQGRVPIISVGGIMTATDVIDRIKNGASLVQIYTSLVYQGPGVVTKLKRDIVKILQEENIDNISNIIGIATRFPKKEL